MTGAWKLLVPVGVIGLIIALPGCGSSDSGSTSTKSTTTSAAPAVKTKFLSCLKQAGIRVVPSGNVSEASGAGAQGRVPIHTPVSAEYLGATDLNRGYFDLWLASDPANAKKAAKQLNAALSKQAGSTLEAASARGVVVNAAPANAGVVSFSDADAIDRCTDQL